jgi:hypothetical protein
MSQQDLPIPTKPYLLKIHHLSHCLAEDHASNTLGDTFKQYPNQERGNNKRAAQLLVGFYYCCQILRKFTHYCFSRWTNFDTTLFPGPPYAQFSITWALLDPSLTIFLIWYPFLRPEGPQSPAPRAGCTPEWQTNKKQAWNLASQEWAGTPVLHVTSLRLSFLICQRSSTQNLGAGRSKQDDKPWGSVPNAVGILTGWELQKNPAQSEDASQRQK